MNIIVETEISRRPCPEARPDDLAPTCGADTERTRTTYISCQDERQEKTYRQNAFYHQLDKPSPGLHGKNITRLAAQITILYKHDREGILSAKARYEHTDSYGSHTDRKRYQAVIRSKYRMNRMGSFKSSPPTSPAFLGVG